MVRVCESASSICVDVADKTLGIAFNASTKNLFKMSVYVITQHLWY